MPETPSSSKGASPGGRQYPAALGFDPGRIESAEKSQNLCMLDNLPRGAVDGNMKIGIDHKDEFFRRPGLNSVGKPITIRINQFKVSDMGCDEAEIAQYDVQIGDGVEPRGKCRAAWKSKAVQSKLGDQFAWLYDGSKLAWSSKKVKEMRILVDFDEEKGREPRPGQKPDTVFVILKWSKDVRLASIKAFLNGRMDFDPSILEGLTFLDHLFRQLPSEKYKVFKRNFFIKNPDMGKMRLDNVLEMYKGVYASARLCGVLPSTASVSGTGIGINVDVANCAFWLPQLVWQCARNLNGKHGNPQLDSKKFRDSLKPVIVKGLIAQPRGLGELRRMIGLKFHVPHTTNGKKFDPETTKTYTIKNFTWSYSPAFFETGVTAKTYKFDWKNPKTGVESNVSVYEFFQQRWNITLEHWAFPLIETEKSGVFPMECCWLLPMQRYQFKLDPEQTASMIKYAVTRPAVRLEAIKKSVKMLDWENDGYLKHFGIKVDKDFTVSHARLLQNPEIEFGGSKRINPKTSGKWDLRQTLFLNTDHTGRPTNLEPLRSWGIISLHTGPNAAELRAFTDNFVMTWMRHGRNATTRVPYTKILTQQETIDLGDSIRDAYTDCGKMFNETPQILFWVMNERNSFVYERLKKNLDCRWAVPSQVLSTPHVKKLSAPYFSNLCMKVNAKLGGTTSRALAPGGKTPLLPPNTMIIGLDVSHPTPGSPQMSMAAMTISIDKSCCRYAALVETNGYRVEMLSKENIQQMFCYNYARWVKEVNNGVHPEHILFFRDGVSERQFTQVLKQEVQEMKQALLDVKWADKAAWASIQRAKWTVTICMKRHNIRFFPRENDFAAGDKFGNPLPGTLVERDVTHPFEYDFYLCSHSAIQGTARPVHYQIIYDEGRLPVDKFQQLIYSHCYQYIRSTTPVSLFPAVYYAHLASNRARSHEDAPFSEGPRGGQKFMERGLDPAVKERMLSGMPPTKEKAPAPHKPLIPMGLPLNPETMKPEKMREILKFRWSMWYI